MCDACWALTPLGQLGSEGCSPRALFNQYRPLDCAGDNAIDPLFRPWWVLEDRPGVLEEISINLQFVWDPAKCPSRAFEQLLRIFETERKKSFAVFSNTGKVRVAKIKRSHATEQKSKVEPFVLAEFGAGELPVYCPFNVRRSFRKGCAGLDVRMVGNSGRHWMPVQQWLHERYGCFNPKPASFDEYLEFVGKPSRFMGLPREIRDQILDIVVGPVIWPHVKTGPGDVDDFNRRQGIYRHREDTGIITWSSCIGIDKSHTVSCRKPCDDLPGLTGQEASCIRGLLLVSRAMNAEIQDAIWRSPKAIFISAGVLREVMLQRRLTQSNTLSVLPLRRVKLSLASDGYFRLIGFKCAPRISFHSSHYSPSTSLELLTSSSQLRSLEFVFNVDTPCQKVFVDFFFTLLYACLVGIYKDPLDVPKVEFEGHVKNSTRRKWEAIWKDWKHGRRHAFMEEFARLSAAQLRHTCSCSRPCNRQSAQAWALQEFDYED